VGQIGDFLDPVRLPYADAVRTAIKRIPQDVPDVGYADSAGLLDKGDRLHFTADSQHKLGKRFAQAMQGIRPTSP
jgi:Carbohydrate esterase, sialic acid-specific acetylesterase